MEATNVAPAPVKRNWSELKEKLRTKFTVLTDADLNFEENKENEMLIAIQTRIGKSKEELASIIASL